MRSNDLRRIVGAMTKDRMVGPAGRLFDVTSLERPENVTAIVALTNHADALAALVETCERLDRAAERGQTQHVLDVVGTVRTALAAVHAVRGEP